MSMYLSIRRSKTSVVIGVIDDSSIINLKRRITGIMHCSTDDMQLTFNGIVLDNANKLSNFNLNTAPGVFVEIGLQLKMENGEFEALELVPYSLPCEIINNELNRDGAAADRRPAN